MKKFLFVFLIFFTHIISVKADSDIYLENLTVMNYEISPKFDKYQNTYTLTINEDISHLNVDYLKENETDIVTVTGNNTLHEGYNEILVTVSNLEETKKKIYTIILTVESPIETVLQETIVNEEKKEIGMNEVSLVTLGGFILIMISYRILLVRKQKAIK